MPNQKFKNGQLIEETVDNGDSTGIRRRWDEHGQLIEETVLTDLPIPEPPEPSVEEILTALLEALGGAV